MYDAGERRVGAIVTLFFNTFDANANSVSIAATPGTISIKNLISGTTYASPLGVTYANDVDTVIGRNSIAIDTGDFNTIPWAAGVEYEVSLNGATIDGKTVNASIATFGIASRGIEASAIAEAVAGYFSELTSLTLEQTLSEIFLSTNDIEAKTDNLPADTAAELTSIKSRTDNLPTDPIAHSVNSGTAYLNVNDANGVQVASQVTLSDMQTTVNAVKAKTDLIATVGMLATNGVTAAKLADDACQKIADILMKRTMAAVEASADGGAVALSSLYGIIQQLQESTTLAAANTLTIYKTDGTTQLGTKALTVSSSAQPVTGIA